MLACFLSARRRILKALPDCPNVRHVEALMLAEHGEINWWSQRHFAAAARRAAERAAADLVNAERVALAILDRPTASKKPGSWMVLAIGMVALAIIATVISYGVTNMTASGRYYGTVLTDYPSSPSRR